jgi:thiamine-phosphate pyrophosphorylase|tara:strand:- start:1106 stop:1669 length:564 start_codon:yes stop_codon:yes gene_type:complete
MTHNYNIYYFIDNFNKDEIFNLNKNINIIYRNYHQTEVEKTIKEISYFCKTNRRKLFISNNLDLALKYNLDGLYLPSFNRSLKYRNINGKKNFKLIGSAHNFSELKIKEKQGCEEIFISPIFYNPKNKNYLDIIKFNNLILLTNKKTIALGGINQKNIKKLKCTKVVGFAGISWIKKNGLRNLGRFK